jgi:signal peptide peptidase SppA
VAGTAAAETDGLPGGTGGDARPRAAVDHAPLALAVFSDDRPWAITRRAIGAMIRAARHPDLEAVAARIGQPVDGGRGVENHNGTAVMDIRGPLFRYRSIWTWLLGGTSVEEAALDLHAALDDPTVNRIVLAINSPGGQIDGINELANMIRAANGTKPVTAYVDGLAASGAYWLASAAGKIVADETSQLGSIGVLATVVDDRDAEEKRGVKRFDIVSSQSPLKRTDPATDEGRAQLQEMVDAMAKVFIEKVAKFRGTSEEKVARDFGRGAVLPARAAVGAGMADSLGSLEAVIQGPDAGAAPIRDIRDKPGLRVAAPTFDEEELEEETDGTTLNDDSSCTCPPGEGDCACAKDEADEEDEEGDENGDEDEDDESEGTEQKPDESSIPKGEGDLIKPTEERQRIAAILNCEEAKGRDELARMLALETNHTVDAAKKLLSAAPVAVAAPPVNALETRMAQIANPKVGVPGEAAGDESAATEVQRILAFVPKERKRMHVQ